MNSSNYIEQKKNVHLYFQVGESKYAVNSSDVLEIMKLPALDYPQKLPNNIVGLLKYNNFVINVIDIRFYLNINVPQYSTENELLIVKTDESIFGIITDKVIGIIPFDAALVDSIPFVDTKTIIDSLYKFNQETVFIINVYAIEKILKEHGDWDFVDITSLFPKDKASIQVFNQRAVALSEKSTLSLVSEFSKSKYISFNLNNDSYCIELGHVKEVLKDTVITPVPGTPDFIEGVMNLRGDYITVLNLKKFLGISTKESQDKKPVIIIQNEEMELAFLIDKINQLFEAQIDKMLDSGDSYFQNEFIYKDAPYTILNIEKIFSDKRILITDM